jgi:hypothetical protein
VYLEMNARLQAPALALGGAVTYLDPEEARRAEAAVGALRQLERDGPSDVPGGAGDERHMPLERHGRRPPRRCRGSARERGPPGDTVSHAGAHRPCPATPDRPRSLALRGQGGGRLAGPATGDELRRARQSRCGAT